jgi:D-alanyl-D-alanine carboxypeptidase/D-alanyl-D-alanine-endopeptidase (penicillin-binding protein 4)
MATVNRRALLAALAALPALSLAGAPSGARAGAQSGAPETSTRPRPRPERGPETVASGAPASAGIDAGEHSAWALCDTSSGAIIDSHRGEESLPPASVTKLLTALYALEHLGPDFAFTTRVQASGPVSGGRLQGDLVLLGSGDPHLDTDHLATLVDGLAATGLRAVDGRFIAVGSALPPLHEIEPSQPDFVGYNPAISGLNLNFNRVYFSWGPDGGDLRLTARAEAHAPAVSLVRVRSEERETPLFRFRAGAAGEEWSVARPALRQAGGRWLPVRAPEIYTAEVFRSLCRAQNIALPPGEVRPAAPDAGTELDRFTSIPLAKIARSMLLFSTNLTAEVLGLATTIAGGTYPMRLADSGAAMTAWAERRLGLRGATFSGHSGLSEPCRVAPAALARALAAPGAFALLKGKTKQPGFSGAEGVTVHAKTGTLNFTRALGGYLEGPKGLYSFAIISSDEARRAAARGEEEESPPGAKTFSARAKALEAQLLPLWAARLRS